MNNGYGFWYINQKASKKCTVWCMTLIHNKSKFFLKVSYPWDRKIFSPRTESKYSSKSESILDYQTVRWDMMITTTFFIFGLQDALKILQQIYTQKQTNKQKHILKIGIVFFHIPLST